MDQERSENLDLTRRRGVILLASFLLIFQTLQPWLITEAKAADTTKTTYLNEGHYNNLVSNSDFIDLNSMSVASIQSFLTTKGSYLAQAPSDQLGEGANGRSAAQIIWDAAHATYGDAQGTLNGITISASTGTISPRAILVTLNKEQGLITNGSYNQRALDCAMGYEGGNGCQWMFDNKPQWKGFNHQVGWAAWQLRYNFEAAGKDASWWSSHYSSPYYVGYSRAHSDTSTGTYYIVTYQNQATSALYRYTPYVANGNYNFWRWMIDWFGTNSGGGGGTINAVDDTEAVSQATYRTSLHYVGTKDTTHRAYYNNQLIGDLGANSWALDISPATGSNNYYITYKDGGGAQVGQKQITIDRRKPGNVNGDGRVDLLDLSLMSDAWGLTVKDDASLNLNPQTDNVVDLLDLSIFANNFEG